MNEYALYKGDDLLDIGTVKELAEKRNVKESTIRYYSTPAYRRKISKRKKAKNYLTLTRLDDDY